jgi:hypothetical protein
LTTGLDQDVTPALAHPGIYRQTWTLPLVFSARDPHALYFGTQVMFRTRNGGNTWQIISPDLTRPNPPVPATLDAPTVADNLGNGRRRGVIYTIAPSPRAADTVWAGTDDGLIWVTRNGGRVWTNVTPRGLTAWSKVTLIEASRRDAGSAYAAVDRHRLDDLRPYIYRTHDGGRSWGRITSGIPDGSYVHVVREDPQRPGLLYTGTETGVYVSFDDGQGWQPLQLNLPPASVRDLAIRQNDLIAGTHGRSCWILDDLSPLRQLSGAIAASRAWLFRPSPTFRVRPGSDQGTPLPAEESAGENPPNGAIIDYYIGGAAAKVTLEILDGTGNIVHRFASDQAAPAPDASKLIVTSNWVHPGRALSAKPGMHRFVWNLRYALPSLLDGGPTSQGPRERGLWAPPGRYSVRLSTGEATSTQPLILQPDPRIRATATDLVQQFKLASRIESARVKAAGAYAEVSSMRKRIAALQRQGRGQNASGQLAALTRLDARLARVGGVAPVPTPDNSVGLPASDRDSLRYIGDALTNLQNAVESADVAPTADERRAFRQQQEKLAAALGRWSALKSVVNAAVGRP